MSLHKGLVTNLITDNYCEITLFFASENDPNMAKQKKTTRPSDNTTKKDKALKNLEIRVNTLGQIEKDFNIDEINAFLNKNVPDKKFEE